jgi:hypothetical protein
MYRPGNGIWVPLGGFTWHFIGTAIVTGKQKPRHATLVDTVGNRPRWPGNYDGDHPTQLYDTLPYLSRSELAVADLPAKDAMAWPLWSGDPFIGPVRDAPCN